MKGEVWVVLFNDTEQMAHAERYYAEEQAEENFGEHLGNDGERFKIARYVPDPPRSKREEAVRALYIQTATTNCAASVARKERALEEAESDNDSEAIEVARGSLEKARALLGEAIRLAGQNFDMTADLAESK